MFRVESNYQLERVNEMDSLTLDSQVSIDARIYEIWSSSFAAEVKKDGEIIKRFRGETAWSDAERYVSDLVFYNQFAK